MKFSMETVSYRVNTGVSCHPSSEFDNPHLAKDVVRLREELHTSGSNRFFNLTSDVCIDNALTLRPSEEVHVEILF